MLQLMARKTKIMAALEAKRSDCGDLSYPEVTYSRTTTTELTTRILLRAGELAVDIVP